jgi:quinol monooxygenase YgiN
MPETIRFARRVLLRVQPGRAAEFMKTMEANVYPKISTEGGIRRIYLLRDTTNPDEFISLTLWNSKKQADSYEDSGHFREYVELIADKLQEPVSISEYSVEHHEVNPSLVPQKAESPPPRAAPRPKSIKKPKTPKTKKKSASRRK